MYAIRCCRLRNLRRRVRVLGTRGKEDLTRRGRVYSSADGKVELVKLARERDVVESERNAAAAAAGPSARAAAAAMTERARGAYVRLRDAARRGALEVFAVTRLRTKANFHASNLPGHYPIACRCCYTAATRTPNSLPTPHPLRNLYLPNLSDNYRYDRQRRCLFPCSLPDGFRI